MKYRIAICDDEQNQIEYITSIVASWSAHEGHSCEIRTFASAEAFLFEYEEDKAYDILLFTRNSHQTRHLKAVENSDLLICFIIAHVTPFTIKKSNRIISITLCSLLP